MGEFLFTPIERTHSSIFKIGVSIHRRYCNTIVKDKSAIYKHPQGVAFAADHDILFHESIEAPAKWMPRSQDRWQIGLYRRQDAGDWLLSVAKKSKARVSLSVVGCELALADMYERVLQPQR